MQVKLERGAPILSIAPAQPMNGARGGDCSASPTGCESKFAPTPCGPRSSWLSRAFCVLPLAEQMAYIIRGRADAPVRFWTWGIRSFAFRSSLANAADRDSRSILGKEINSSYLFTPSFNAPLGKRTGRDSDSTPDMRAHFSMPFFSALDF